MSVELKTIPEKLIIPEPPLASRWFIIIVVITVLGIIPGLYLWPEQMSTHSAWFWFCILVIPLSVGFACYAFRLRDYENQRDRVNHWNRLQQKQYDIQVKKRQRSAGLLGKTYITPIACNKLAAALINYGSQLQSVYFEHLQKTLTTAQLEPSATYFSEESYRIRLVRYLTQLLRMLEPDLSALPAGRLSVRLRHDGSLDNRHITQIWRDIFPASYAVDQLVAEVEGDGMMWLVPWLDQRCTTPMLSVEINLFIDPRNYQSESVSALLLAPPDWLDQHDVIPEVAIHRPVVVTENIASLEDMLLWGSLSADEAHTLWQEQIDKDVLTRLLQQAESIGYSPGQSEGYILDDLFGHCGAATGNISLICACEHAMTSGKPQWMIMADKTTHQAIVRQI